MKTILSTIACIFLVQTLWAQGFQDIVKAQSEEQLDDLCETALLGFSGTPEEVDRLVTDIINAAGLKKSFELKACSNISNAIAKILKINGEDKRIIVYDPEWLEQLSKNKSDWSGKMIMAHEIGHHLNGHSLNNGGSTHERELEADFFAGARMADLGATLGEVEVAANIFPANGSSSHPGRNERKAELIAGFKSRARNNKTLDIKVLDADAQRSGQRILERVKGLIFPDDNALVKEDIYRKSINLLNTARTNYYKGYTEDIRYYETYIYRSLGEKEKTREAMENYLSIKDLSDRDRIKQLTGYIAKDNIKARVVFNNLDVVYELSKAYFKNGSYKNAMKYGNQFLGQSLDTSLKDEISILIADSEVELILKGDSTDKVRLNAEELVFKAKKFIENQDYSEAYAILISENLAKNAKAKYFLATLYLEGKGTSQNLDLARSLLNVSAQEGYAKAQYKLGLCYYNGTFADNKYLAEFWLNKAVKNEAFTLKAQEALNELNALKAKNRNTPAVVTNVTKEEKEAKALAQAASYFESGYYDRAFELYLPPANNGNRNAQSNIAWMLYKGKGTTKNKSEAIRYWTLAAKQGEVDAINYLTRLGKW